MYVERYSMADRNKVKNRARKAVKKDNSKEVR